MALVGPEPDFRTGPRWLLCAVVQRSSLRWVLRFVDHVVARAGIFRQLQPAVLAAVINRLEPVDHPVGHLIFSEGQPGDRMYIIESGKVKISRRFAHGDENVQTVLGVAQIFGELSVLDPGPRTSTATALTDVRLMSMHRCQLREWIADHPGIGEQLLRVLARRVRRTTAHRSDLVFMDVAGRLAKQLLLLGQQFGSREDGAMRVASTLVDLLLDMAPCRNQPANPKDDGPLPLRSSRDRAAVRRCAGPQIYAGTRKVTKPIVE